MENEGPQPLSAVGVPRAPARNSIAASGLAPNRSGPIPLLVSASPEDSTGPPVVVVLLTVVVVDEAVVLVDVDDDVVGSGSVVVVVVAGAVDPVSMVTGGEASELEPEHAALHNVKRANPRISRMNATVRLRGRRFVAGRGRQARPLRSR